MDNTKALERLDRFRRAVYDRVLGHRKDTMFELMEAVLVADRPANLVHLSLEAVFRRRWPSASDALAAGRVRPMPSPLAECARCPLGWQPGRE